MAATIVYTKSLTFSMCLTVCADRAIVIIEDSLHLVFVRKPVKLLR